VIIARYREQLSDLLPDHAANIEAAIAAISKHQPPLWDAAVEERLARILIGLDKPTTNLEKALVNVGAEHG